jgi:hypothetical protein
VETKNTITESTAISKKLIFQISLIKLKLINPISKWKKNARIDSSLSIPKSLRSSWTLTLLLNNLQGI